MTLAMRTSPKGEVSVGKTLAYCRVSTDGQTVESQKTQIKDYVRQRGLASPEWYTDIASGKIPISERPAGGELVRALRPGDHIIITRLDRAFRRMADCIVTIEEWRNKRVNLHVMQFGGMSLDLGTPIGMFLVQVLSAAAELERAFASERTKEAIRSGNLQAYPKMGFKFEWLTDKTTKTGKRKILLPDPVERSQMALILKWKIEGMSFMGIVDHVVHTLKWTRTMGRIWDFNSVYKAVALELQLQQEEMTNYGVSERIDPREDA